MRRFLSTVLYVFMGLPLALGGLLLLSVRPWALDRDFYRSAVNDERLYEALRSPAMAEDVQARLEIGGATFDGPVLVAAVQPRLPEAELKALGNSAIDAALDRVEGKATGPIVLDLKPLKTAFRGAAPATASAYVRGLPAARQLPAPGDLTALPPGLPASRAEKAAATALVAAVDAIPDTATGGAIRLEAGMPVGQAGLDRAAIGMAALAAALVAAFATVGGGGLAAILARAGTMTILPSVFVLSLGAILALPGAAVLERFFPPELRGALGEHGVSAFRGWLSGVLGVMSRGFFVTGLVGASLGGLVTSLRRIFAPREY